MLTSSVLMCRLRSGVRCEPDAVVIEWRSCFEGGPALETGFDSESGLDASSDAAALCGDELHRVSEHFPNLPRWRASYSIRPAVA